MLAKPKSHDKKTETVVKRSSRRHDDDAHGGAWKVAFADFSLALMCLFLGHGRAQPGDISRSCARRAAAVEEARA